MEKATLDLLMLAAVEREPLHGYALIQRLRELSNGTFALAEGTVYPALHRLEREGLLVSRKSPVLGRTRRVYALTDAGRGMLAEREQGWQRLTEGVRLVLEGRA